ncbi:hypothetical protein [uncultured Dokdonia sp.]|uniref:hypothetical protein n=1 Tax=uncultured Dokdonia sp. TaxID=575653 RepID=UPI00261C11B1|nr:hypothetical protein [uncultured Dokdonia sp.]
MKMIKAIGKSIYQGNKNLMYLFSDNNNHTFKEVIIFDSVVILISSLYFLAQINW